MENTGQIYAYDADRMRLRPIFERLKRAGVRNVQVLAAGDPAALAELAGKMDRVVIDAPCTGSGVWRRRPGRQMAAVAGDARGAGSPSSGPCSIKARALVKPGGRLAYVTCSVLPPENRDQVDAFLARYPRVQDRPLARGLGAAALSAAPPPSADGSAETLLMTPLSFGTDGFYVAVLERR